MQGVSWNGFASIGFGPGNCQSRRYWGHPHGLQAVADSAGTMKLKCISPCRRWNWSH